ncbi:hypothetical protein NL676_028959 [Syzygium grande]|nr:hypothetical protein NL676_028959 [Syzygium grande]
MDSYERFSPMIFIFLAIKLCKRRKPKLPRGPYPLPFKGNLHQIKPNTAAAYCFTKWLQLLRPCHVGLARFQAEHCYVSRPELAKEVLKGHQVSANWHRMESTVKITRDGMGLVRADYGPHFVKLRKICVLELMLAARMARPSALGSP